MLQSFQGSEFKLLGRNVLYGIFIKVFHNNSAHVARVCSVIYGYVCFQEGKNSRLSLHILQQAAGDKENLVGGSRQPVTNVKAGVKLG